jgi:uncharacterized protein Yka (UPF0111/DUF47 family)
MQKSDAVATLAATHGALGSLLQPARLRAALRANDRLKLYLTVLQAAASHARAPQQPLLDLAREIRAADITVRADADWLSDLPATATLQGDTLRVPDLPRLATSLHDDLQTMARPLVDDGVEGADDREAATLGQRVQHWLDELAALQSPTLDGATLDALTHARRDTGDSLHLTVMDLHKALNRLAGTLASDTIDGAHVWQLAADGSDAPRVRAFMRGIERTRALKLEHPGLETAATRDARRLLIQNDIGTNDAHVLVIQVDTVARPMTTTLTYSDLHRQRFAFFQRQLQALGARWSQPQAQRSEGLNRGDDYVVGTAEFQADDEAALAAQLEGIGERIVFLIDWNRARRRLLAFTDKAGAVAVLEEAARRRVGHRAWLASGGERLLWSVMAAQGEGSFRLGDRLDDVLGAEAAHAWLTDVLALAWRVREQGQPAALVADESRALLARLLQGRRHELDLLEEHAALIHALMQALRDGLAHGWERNETAATEMAARAKAWERQADHLVMQARSEAARQPQRLPLLRLVETSDDVADAVEEACFLLSLLAEHFGAVRGADGRRMRLGWSPPVRTAVGALAEAMLQAVQDHVKALAVARSFDETSDSGDHDEFLSACWRVLQAERQCDALLRSARRAMAQEARDRNDAVALTLGTDLAAAIEAASDALLALGHGLRDRVLQRLGGQGG